MKKELTKEKKQKAVTFKEVADIVYLSNVVNHNRETAYLTKLQVTGSGGFNDMYNGELVETGTVDFYDVSEGLAGDDERWDEEYRPVTDEEAFEYFAEGLWQLGYTGDINEEDWEQLYYGTTCESGWSFDKVWDNADRIYIRHIDKKFLKNSADGLTREKFDIYYKIVGEKFDRLYKKTYTVEGVGFDRLGAAFAFFGRWLDLSDEKVEKLSGSEWQKVFKKSKYMN